MDAYQILGKKIREWKANPILFVREVFKVEPDIWQAEALEAFASNDPMKTRISLQACAGPGKSTVLAWCGWNFLLCYGERGNHPKGAAVSISAANLKDNLWSEMSKWQSASTILQKLFTWTHTRIFANDHPSTWFFSARAFANSANTEEIGRTLSGLHSKYVLYLIDESGDIPPTIIKAAEQGLSTGPEFGKILQAGNPTSHSGMLYVAATSLRDQWHVITITGDPDDSRRSPRIKIEWAREQIQKYSRTNPWVMSYILGQFPPSSINTLLGPDEVQAAMNREIYEESYKDAQKRLGVDVSRFGSDRTIIFPRQGLRAFTPVEMRNARTNDIAARVMQAKSKWGSELEFIDGTGGFGGGVVDSLIQAGCSPIEVHFSGKATDSRYYNKRAEMWFMMAEWIKRGGVLPKDSELLKELTTPTYTFQNGKFMLESKDQIKERLGYSCDKSDGLCLTFSLPELPSQTSPLSIIQKQNYKHDYDPFATD